MRRHDLDLTSLVWGVLFLAIAAVGAVTALGGGWRLDPRWVVPGLLVLLGGVGLLSALAPRRDDDPSSPDDDPGLLPGLDSEQR
ncbi:MAG: hypothetical protein ACTHOD_10015 [Motilibacteraceae bacterium]